MSEEGVGADEAGEAGGAGAVGLDLSQLSELMTFPLLRSQTAERTLQTVCQAQVTSSWNYVQELVGTPIQGSLWAALFS